MSYPFEQAVAEHDERKTAIRESLGHRVLPDEQAGLYVLGSTLAVDELLRYCYGQAEALFNDLPRAVSQGVHPQAVVAGYLADAMTFGERVGRKRTEGGE